MIITETTTTFFRLHAARGPILAVVQCSRRRDKPFRFQEINDVYDLMSELAQKMDLPYHKSWWDQARKLHTLHIPEVRSRRPPDEPLPAVVSLHIKTGSSSSSISSSSSSSSSFSNEPSDKTSDSWLNWSFNGSET